MSSVSEVIKRRESLRIPVSMFWSRTSSPSFYQNFESPNVPFAPSKYLNFDLTGWHVADASINRETSSCKRHRNLSSLTFGICNKLNKVSHRNAGVQTIEYLSLVINSIQMTLSLTEEKVKEISQECKIIFSMKEITVLQLTQLLVNTFIM